MRIGLISDTHGLLRPQIFDLFAGVNHILHAGDVGPLDILTELEAIAPVTAVHGNTDGWDVCERLPDVAELSLGGARVIVLHGDQFGSPVPTDLATEYPNADLLVYGHTHQGRIEKVGDLLCVNPGSAGPRRFKLRPSVALAEIEDGQVEARLVPL